MIKSRPIELEIHWFLQTYSYRWFIPEYNSTNVICWTWNYSTLNCNKHHIILNTTYVDICFVDLVCNGFTLLHGNTVSKMIKSICILNYILIDLHRSFYFVVIQISQSINKPLNTAKYDSKLILNYKQIVVLIVKCWCECYANKAVSTYLGFIITFTLGRSTIIVPSLGFGLPPPYRSRNYSWNSKAYISKINFFHYVWLK